MFLRRICPNLCPILYPVLALAGAWPAVALASDAARDCQLPLRSTHSVAAVVDGRTLKLDDGTELRLTGLIAPTSYDSPAAPADWPAGLQAVAGLKALALGRNVMLSLERTARDRYGRLGGQALLAEKDGDLPAALADRWLQARIAAAGMARIDLSPDVDAPCARLLLRHEALAEKAGLGLWGLAAYHVKRAEDAAELLRYRSTFQIVQGVIARVSVTKSSVYLNFGRDWKRDFAAKLSRAVLKREGIEAEAMRRLKGAAVRVRGWVERRNGPMITLWRSEQVEFLRIKPDGSAERGEPPELLGNGAAAKLARRQ